MRRARKVDRQDIESTLTSHFDRRRRREDFIVDLTDVCIRGVCFWRFYVHNVVFDPEVKNYSLGHDHFVWDDRFGEIVSDPISFNGDLHDQLEFILGNENRHPALDYWEQYDYFFEFDNQDKIHIARCREWPSLSTHGQDPKEALKKLTDLIKEEIDLMIMDGESVPKPLSLLRG